MKSKWLACVSVVFILACAIYSVAQDSPTTNITGSGTKGTVPVFTGTHSIGKSKITQDSSGNEHFAAGIDAIGVISGSSDVDAGGNVNATGNVNASGGVNVTGNVGATGYIYSSDYIESPYVYGTGYGEFPELYAGQGTFNTSAGRAIIAETADGTQAIQGQQFYAGGYEFAFFDLNGKAVFYGDYLGDTIASGSKSAAVPLKNGKMVKVYSQESPQVWFEDYGSATLVGGVATVKLESQFSQLVDTKVPYHVFLTPDGDCHGLYIAQKDQNSFEVRELNNGESNVAFEYRISALRNGYEKVRLEPAKMPTAGKAPQRPPLPKK